jgi:hypothetical protein
LAAPRKVFVALWKLWMKREIAEKGPSVGTMVRPMAVDRAASVAADSAVAAAEVVLADRDAMIAGLAGTVIEF